MEFSGKCWTILKHSSTALRRAPNGSRFYAAPHPPGGTYSAARHSQNIFGADSIEKALFSGEASFKFFGGDYVGHGREETGCSISATCKSSSRNFIDPKAFTMQANSASVCVFLDFDTDDRTKKRAENASSSRVDPERTSRATYRYTSDRKAVPPSHRVEYRSLSLSS